MGNQYKIEAGKIERWGNSSSSTITCKTFNAQTWAPAGYYEQNLKNAKVGDVIIEVVGVVRERPKMTSKVVPFAVGDIRTATNGVRWKLVGILYDRLVWANADDTGPSLFTKVDGTPWRDGYTGFNPRIKEVADGYEKYLDKE